MAVLTGAIAVTIAVRYGAVRSVVRLGELAYVPSSLPTKGRGQIAPEGLTDSWA